MNGKRVRDSVIRSGIVFFCALALSAADRGTGEYVVVLESGPLAAAESFGKAAPRAAAADAVSRLAAEQATVRAALEGRGYQVLGSVDTVLNAVFVRAGGASAEELKSIAGVRRVEPVVWMRRQMAAALDLVRAAQGWNNVGGPQNAGAGVKIAVLDSGLDHTHPGLRDDSLSAPAGYPRCTGSDCAYATSKIIAVRNYQSIYSDSGDPEFSHPDDPTPRDRSGHGTAVAFAAAGNRVQSPLGMVSGVAPKAWLGNYKISGSAGVNDFVSSRVFLLALDDAVKDGMDIAVFSYGRAAFWGATDSGAVCGLRPGEFCDLQTEAVENAIRAGMTVVISAGNSGDVGSNPPAGNTITSPATAPSAISVGSSTNAQRYVSTVSGPQGAPAAARQIAALFGDGPRPSPSLSAPARDVRTLDNDGKACVPLGNGALAGLIALIDRGDCEFSVKAGHAQRAGAVGVVLIQSGTSDSIFPPTGLNGTGIPLAMIGATGGAALRGYVNANPGAAVTMDVTLRADPQAPNQVSYFSSYGPSIRTNAIKPELAAPGDPLYMATQRLDPNGEMYSANGWTAAQGTSFAAPVAAGAAAIFKQRFRNATPAQIKSAVVNGATTDVDDFIDGQRISPARVTAVGAGKLNVENTARTTLTADPPVLNFGLLTQTVVGTTITVRLSNLGAQPVTAGIEMRRRDADTATRFTLSNTSLNIAPNGTAQLLVRLEGQRPRAGAYEGALVVTGGATTLRIPYLYIVSDGALFDAFPLSSQGFDGIAGENMPGGAFNRLVLKAVDQFGVALERQPVRYIVTKGSGRVDRALPETDDLGIAAAGDAFLGPEVGPQEFAAEVGGSNKITVRFAGNARLRPSIRTDGVVNAASQTVGRGVAPGSYISIYGANLADSTRVFAGSELPYGLAGVSVAFDVPGRGLSYAGRIHFVSPGQVNVQVPWELQGFNSALMKVNLGNFSSALYTVPLNDLSPAAFEFNDPVTGRLLAAALDSGFALITEANAAARGQFVQIYCNGLGPVDNTPPTGEVSSSNPLSRTRTAPEVTIGGRPATVVFSGLAPGNVGLNQINVQVPADAPTGLQPVVIKMGDVTAKTVSLPVR